MTVGRKPKPTGLKLVTGNPGKRALPKKEAKIDLSEPTPPAHLSDDAKVEWGRVCSLLYKVGLMTEADRAALGAYCQAYGRWAQAERMLASKSLLTQTTNGNIIQSPLVGIANKSMGDMVRYAAEFGMTPSARARVEATPPHGEEKNSLTKFFG